MIGPEEERGPSRSGPAFFTLNFPAVSLMYSILFERDLCLPSREELMDEIERKELYPLTRHVIPQAMDDLDYIRESMRKYLVFFAGEAAVVDLENRVRKMIERTERE
jgi:hypothetical protein